ncbi:hypothetical protein DL95DRAFT_428188 [Leptodontidium sp. 2 PMI_412]|nr:hypothetical protein DL95DRAFT_428188 [Leptodontidium sp. 2 PMI_412]
MILRTPLPYYSGTYSVGMMDIEVPKHLLELEAVLFSVFYPSGLGSGQGTSPEGMKKWKVAKGYGKFAGLLQLTKNSREGGYETKNRAGTRPPGEPEKACFPLFVFSHGLEFAGYGFVVVSLEHRDGNGPRNFVNIPNEGEDLNNRKVNLSDEARRKGYSKMAYVFPTNNVRNTLPGNKQGVDVELRSAQIQLRLAEIEGAYHVMTLIHDDGGEGVAKANLRGKTTGTGAAIQPPEKEPRHRIDAPLLAINSEAFMYWPDNFESVMSLYHEAKDHDELVWMMTVRGSVHISQSDFSLLYPRIASLLLKMTVNPRCAIDLNINASLEFVKKVMLARISAVYRGTDEHLLEVRTLDKLATEHRPDEKWAVMRLRILHEMRIRLRPQWVRRHERKKRRNSFAKHLPRDPQGNVLEGLEDLELGEEIWMYVAPTKEELERHGLMSG